MKPRPEIISSLRVLANFPTGIAVTFIIEYPMGLSTGQLEPLSL